MRKFGKVFDLLERFGMSLAGLCLGAMMLIVTFDALSRYVLRAPFTWSHDLISYYLLPAATFFAASSTFKAGGHLTMDFVTSQVSRVTNRRLLIISDLMVIPVVSVMFYSAAAEAFSAYVERRFHPGAYLWPSWITYAVIALGIFVFLIRLVIHLIGLIDAEYRKSTDDVAMEQEELL